MKAVLLTTDLSFKYISFFFGKEAEPAAKCTRLGGTRELESPQMLEADRGPKDILEP